jgi:hypothetical protein
LGLIFSASGVFHFGIKYDVPTYAIKVNYFSSRYQRPRLPDGIFSYQKFQFGHILESLGIKKCRHILGPFGMLYQEISGNPV